MNERATIDVAFELARSGRFRSIAGLKKELEKQGCDQVGAHLAGSSLKAQLLKAIKDAQG